MIKPFRKDFTITQVFGINKENYSKFGLQGHNGVDYGMPIGSDIIAPHAGKVIEMAFDKGGYGLYCKIENDKEGSVLAHWSEHFVSVGTEVMEGALIGRSGNTGNSTGPHLHWGWYMKPRNRGNGFNGFEDQLLIFKAMQQKYFIQPQSSEAIEKLKKEYEGKIANIQADCQKQLQEHTAKIKETILNLIKTNV